MSATSERNAETGIGRSTVTFVAEIVDRAARVVWRGTALEREHEKSERQAEMAK